MMPVLAAAEHRGRYRLWLRFVDGAEGETDLEDELRGSVFHPLKDESFFAKLTVHPELHTLTWPNEADFAPEFLDDKLKATTNQNRRSARHHAAE